MTVSGIINVTEGFAICKSIIRKRLLWKNE